MLVKEIFLKHVDITPNSNHVFLFNYYIEMLENRGDKLNGR